MPIVVTPVFYGAPSAFGYIGNAATEAKTRSTTLQTALPTYQSGDLLIAMIASNGYTVSTPSGWTKRITPSSTGIHVYTKTAVANETAPTFTYGSDDIQVGCVVSVRSAVYVSCASVNDSSTLPACASVAGGLALGFLYDYHGGATTRDYSGSGWTEVVDTTSGTNDGNGYYNHWGLYRIATTGANTPASGIITDNGESLTYLLATITVGPG